MANPKGNPTALISFTSSDSSKGAKTEQITVRIRPEQKEGLKAIPEWTVKLRAKIDQLIEEELGTDH